MVIWLTGLSDSGKTSISKEFLRISSKENKFISIDGDDIRLIFNNKLGFSKPERIKHINHIQKLAKFLEQNHIMVIVSALYCNSDILKWNRKNFKKYIEVFVKTDKKTLIKRDTKGIYNNYKNKKMKNVVGFDIRYFAPKNPDILIDTNKSSIEKSAKKIYKYFKKLTNNN
tara:strand:+ start:127 stop:639 length:513 start_codon:yes stop_codon:yes gene_type:complete